MSALEQAVEADTGFASAHYRLAELWRGQMALTSFTLTLPDLSLAQQMAKFESSILAAINSAASSPARDLYEAKRAQVKLRYRDAVRFYRAYVNSRPNDHEAWFWLAQVYQQIGDFDSAFAAVQQAAAHPGLDATLDSRLLWGYYRSGRAEEGAAAARQVAIDIADARNRAVPGSPSAIMGGVP